MPAGSCSPWASDATTAWIRAKHRVNAPAATALSSCSGRPCLQAAAPGGCHSAPAVSGLANCRWKGAGYPGGCPAADQVHTSGAGYPGGCPAAGMQARGTPVKMHFFTMRHMYFDTHKDWCSDPQGVALQQGCRPGAHRSKCIFSPCDTCTLTHIKISALIPRRLPCSRDAGQGHTGGPDCPAGPPAAGTQTRVQLYGCAVMACNDEGGSRQPSWLLSCRSAVLRYVFASDPAVLLKTADSPASFHVEAQCYDIFV
eukprot:1161982-Pelagomonas_calceolata.AAC.9